MAVCSAATNCISWQCCGDECTARKQILPCAPSHDGALVQQVPDIPASACTQFAISTATIVSGAVAERVKFIAYACYAFFLTAWVSHLVS